MTKNSSAEALAKIIGELEPLEAEERARIIRSICTFFGSDAPLITSQSSTPGAQVTPGGGLIGSDAKTYFDRKQPKSKLEELAVAARFREETQGAEMSSQEELKGVFNAARRTFDAHNFRRDLDNARTKGLFLRGTARGVAQLSSGGQNLVDALPDRQTVKVKASKRPRKKSK